MISKSKVRIFEFQFIYLNSLNIEQPSLCVMAVQKYSLVESSSRQNKWARKWWKSAQRNIGLRIRWIIYFKLV